MISRIEALSALPVPEDPFTLRIVSAAEAYGLSTPFLDVWQGNGCLFSRMDGVLTIAGKPDPNEIQETALFAASCGAGQIFCAPDTARALGFPLTETGPVLYRDQPETEAPSWEEPPSPRVLYEILSACEGEGFPVPEFEPFYLDTSHRLRHGTAKAVVLCENGQPAACALALAVTQNAALLTAVAVRPAFRRKGLGQQAVESLCRKLPGRRVFLFRSNTENKEFYESLGFSPWGEWGSASPFSPADA